MGSTRGSNNDQFHHKGTESCDEGSEVIMDVAGMYVSAVASGQYQRERRFHWMAEEWQKDEELQLGVGEDKLSKEEG